jgi:hypothetical protein
VILDYTHITHTTIDQSPPTLLHYTTQAYLEAKGVIESEEEHAHGERQKTHVNTNSCTRTNHAYNYT